MKERKVGKHCHIRLH